MNNAYKYKNVIKEKFYLDNDDITVRHKYDDSKKGKFKKNDPVKTYHISGKNRTHVYKGIHIPGTDTSLGIHWVLSILRELNFKPTSVIDHIDGNVNNNHRNNIRITTQKINCRNRTVRNNNKTGYTGISFRKGKSIVRFTINEKRISKSFNTLQEAKEYIVSIKDILFKEGYTYRHIFGSTAIERYLSNDAEVNQVE